MADGLMPRFELLEFRERRRLGEMDRRHEIGAAGERAAERLLRRRRYSIVARNYRCRGGEIDLVALKNGAVVFVEVRTRAVGSLVHPLESIDGRKRRRIVTAARHYVARNRLHEHPMRFDVVAVFEEAAGLRCELVEDAFNLNDLPPYRPPW